MHILLHALTSLSMRITALHVSHPLLYRFKRVGAVYLQVQVSFSFMCPYMMPEKENYSWHFLCVFFC